MAGQNAHKYNAENPDATLVKLIKKQLESGADLNLCFISEHWLYYVKPRPYLEEASYGGHDQPRALFVYNCAPYYVFV